MSVIQVKNLSKKYQIYHEMKRISETLREAFPHLVAGQEFERGTEGVTNCKADKAASQAISATHQTRPT